MCTGVSAGLSIGPFGQNRAPEEDLLHEQDFIKHLEVAQIHFVNADLKAKRGDLIGAIIERIDGDLNVSFALAVIPRIADPTRRTEAQQAFQAFVQTYAKPVMPFALPFKLPGTTA